MKEAKPSFGQVIVLNPKPENLYYFQPVGRFHIEEMFLYPMINI